MRSAPLLDIDFNKAKIIIIIATASDNYKHCVKDAPVIQLQKLSLNRD